MSLKLLIAIVITVLVVGIIGSFIAFKDQAIPPQSLLYPVKRAGEWVDVNFLTFGAPEKQVKHQELAGRRLQEFLAQKDRPLPQSVSDILVTSYEQELARAEFMAEQLALLDWRFLPLLEQQYTLTLSGYESLADGIRPATDSFRSATQRYNEQAIKVLLRKHQHTPQLTRDYKKLIQDRADWLQTQQSRLNAQQRQKLLLARKVLQEGKELEWAYDILVSIL